MTTSILNRAISVYSLPAELLSNLSVRSIEAQSSSTATNANDDEPSSNSKTKNGQTHTLNASSTSLGCQTCPNASFETVEEQRNHFKSDWHRYNAKAKLTGRTVTQEEWDNMVEGVSSISGSASSSSSGDSSHSQSKISRLLNRQKLNPTSDGDSDEAAELADRQRRAHLRTAVIWFTPTSPLPSLSVPKDTQFGIHRALFPPFETAGDYLEELRRMQLTGDEEEDQERRITLLMVAGGHFAGMVVGIKPRGKTERQDVKGAGDVRVLQHKTFHRYTTRKKQGGSQALNDNAKSKAVSAGAMLRRYGEQALQEEIRALMIEWAEDINASERIFIRASTHGKKSFWGYEDAPIDKGDERIRSFPFATRRPTLQELLRCWQELTRVKVSHLSEDALQALDEAYIASLQPKNKVIKPTATPAPQPTATPVPRLSPEEEARLDRRRRLEEMIRKGRLDALKPFWAKYKSEYSSLSEILGLASAAGQEDVLRWLLEEERLDPTLPTPEGKFAYDLCSTKGVRNVFRRVAHTYPDWYDWKAARVPSGLSEEMEQEQEKKKAERRKGLREKLKEREKARAEDEQKEEKVSQTPPQLQVPAAAMTGLKGPQKLGGRIGGEGGLAGLSPEMRQQIERERRARAAEARLK
ncbi:hypothetical protein CI109_100924 [Kwoniella shandongensis]|uniref:VLRF1 domain-containing protein n=1 Tax=Kwoniella shandongensis TaxID=1734106 RepID=A0A5M6C4F7_9TREE|nr:uncharacterized protein CI109_001390 [Kwoniella shandongensis]KAA5529988.1 hypothetical protein CI109_001390 [Kwoniella shandongensis]